MIKLLRLAVVMSAALSLTSGCAFWRPDKIHYTVGAERVAPCEACSPSLAGSDFIGVALSGGGARASVFGAAAIEALADAGIMQHATHISSVSGGGFPAAYYALHKPQPCAETNTDDAPCVSESFAVFKELMRHNFLTDMTLRQLVRPNRFTSPTRRLLSLRDALDNQFINDATFSDLPPTPILLINGARYDDGRRFVFSNQSIPEKQSNIPPFTEQTLQSASFSLPGCTRATPSDLSVALAIAVSAGFPPLLGPAAIETPESCEGGATRYWHLGDGGILDNTGVESLEDFALHADMGGAEIKRVIIFSFDAGRSTSPDVMMGKRNLKLWTSDPGRVVDIVGKRANAYRHVALGEHYAASGVEFNVLEMRYTDAVIERWPESCGNREGGAAEIQAYLETVPTNFKITDCNADLMELAAHSLVRTTLRENAKLLNGAGLLPE
ncbi:patatin-like phospholipase family protein [Hyphococcus sp.]|uniref:patatin-like phospholipase family protein n=1 Tax=Hyphococcus sp. TaxID=2038636 RepID=UPI00374FEE0F